jgi:translation initiation factor eIF-2B subunit delta
VTKVILGAAAVLSNGTVVSRAGSASVAMVAAAAGRPVMVCCETLKFHERVQVRGFLWRAGAEGSHGA